jgi:F-type H+-transporting ATPase subunit delta
VSDSIILTSGVSGRYATALFSLGKEENTLDRFEKDLGLISELIVSNSEFRRLIDSPIYKRFEQERAIVEVSQKLKLSKNVENILSLLASKRRLQVLTELIKDFKSLIKNERGEVVAEVVAVRDLNKSQKLELEKSLKATTGKKVNLSIKIDKNILGGLIIKVGSKMIDSSVRSKLLKLQNIMKEVS